jgi:hypothetical protein
MIIQNLHWGSAGGQKLGLPSLKCPKEGIFVWYGPVESFIYIHKKPPHPTWILRYSLKFLSFPATEGLFSFFSSLNRFQC